MFRSRVQFLCLAIVMLIAGAGATALEIHRHEHYAPPAVKLEANRAPHYYDWPHGLPTGITLSGLQDYIISSGVISMLEHQTHAIYHFWHSRYVRYQIQQDRFVGADGRHPDISYQRDVFRIINYALSLHMTVVLNAQTEVSTGYSLSEPLPTYATTVFWKVMLSRYGQNRHIVFDLFNEPRPVCAQTGSRLPSTCVWNMWYAAMYPLEQYVRAHTRDWIWIEGIDWASSLKGMPLIRGYHVAYSFHHPGQAHSGTQHTASRVWYENFGYLADKGYPVIDGEFPNFVGSYDWIRPLHTMKEYLAYLAGHHIGMLAWSLVPGSLNSNLQYTSLSIEPQGDGFLVHSWFIRASKSNT